MARRQEVYTARRAAPPPKAKEPDKRTDGKDGKERRVAAAQTEAASPRRRRQADAPAQKEAPKASASKKAGAVQKEKPIRPAAAPKAAKQAAAKPPVRRGRVLEAGSQERELRREGLTRAEKRELKEKKRSDAIYRDRRRAVSRGGGAGVALIALLTALLVAGGLLLRAFAADGQTDMQALVLLSAMVPLGLATTLLLPRFLPIDALTMALTNLLCGVSVVILYTVSPERGVRQTVFYAAGLAVMLVMAGVVSHVRRWKGLTLLAMVLGVGALILPLAFGEWVSGAKNWVELPVMGSFQPSELVKLSLVLTLAYYFSAHRTVWQMMPAIVFATACLLLLMLQRDLGTALIYYLTTLVLFYAACGNLPLTLVGMAGGVGAAVLGYRMFAHVKVRVAMWKNPWSDPLDKGYQIIQALLAIGSGGLFGVGLGQGTPEKIPEYHNDFIFAVICEQMGLIFGLLLLVVYVLLIARGVTVINRSRRSFDLLLGCGVLAMLAIQTLMIVAGVVKMIPLTGVTMPLMSYGGSSLISCMAMVGILHGISARAQDDMEEDILGV